MVFSHLFIVMWFELTIQRTKPHIMWQHLWYRQQNDSGDTQVVSRTNCKSSKLSGCLTDEKEEAAELLKRMAKVGKTGRYTRDRRGQRVEAGESQKTLRDEKLQVCIAASVPDSRSLAPNTSYTSSLKLSQAQIMCFGNTYVGLPRSYNASYGQRQKKCMIQTCVSIETLGKKAKNLNT